MKLLIGGKSRNIYMRKDGSAYYKSGGEKVDASYMFKKNGDLKKQYSKSVEETLTKVKESHHIKNNKKFYGGAQVVKFDDFNEIKVDFTSKTLPGKKKDLMKLVHIGYNVVLERLHTPATNPDRTKKHRQLLLALQDIKQDIKQDITLNPTSNFARAKVALGQTAKEKELIKKGVIHKFFSYKYHDWSGKYEPAKKMFNTADSILSELTKLLQVVTKLSDNDVDSYYRRFANDVPSKFNGSIYIPPPSRNPPGTPFQKEEEEEEEDNENTRDNMDSMYNNASVRTEFDDELPPPREDLPFADFNYPVNGDGGDEDADEWTDDEGENEEGDGGEDGIPPNSRSTRPVSAPSNLPGVHPTIIRHPPQPETNGQARRRV
jgi:hypothetical protein